MFRAHAYFLADFKLPYRTTLAQAGICGHANASSTVPLDPITGLVKEAPGYGCSM